jgi:hypothetical protein
MSLEQYVSFSSGGHALISIDSASSPFSSFLPPSPGKNELALISSFSPIGNNLSPFSPFYVPGRSPPPQTPGQRFAEIETILGRSQGTEPTTTGSYREKEPGRPDSVAASAVADPSPAPSAASATSDSDEPHRDFKAELDAAVEAAAEQMQVSP